jgi:hypothetical protein
VISPSNGAAGGVARLRRPQRAALKNNPHQPGNALPLRASPRRMKFVIEPAETLRRSPMGSLPREVFPSRHAQTNPRDFREDRVAIFDKMPQNPLNIVYHRQSRRTMPTIGGKSRESCNSFAFFTVRVERFCSNCIEPVELRTRHLPRTGTLLT